MRQVGMQMRLSQLSGSKSPSEAISMRSYGARFASLSKDLLLKKYSGFLPNSLQRLAGIPVVDTRINQGSS